MSRRLAAAVGAAVAACGAAAGVFPIFESDLFWHLAAGRWIVERGEIPRVDPFRFAPERALWVDHEWLFQVAAHGVERLGGLDALILARAAALAGFALLLFFVARRAGLGPGLAGLVALGATLGVRPRFLVRPEIATLFAIVTLLVLLERALERTGPRWRRFAPAFALTVVWVQLHGEALLAPALAFLFLLGAAAERRTDGPTLVGVPAGLAAALLVNPYGWRLLEVPLGILGAMRELPAHNPEWMSALEAPQPFLFGGLAVVAALAAAARRERGRWPALAWGLPTAALALVALSAVRHQALFYAAAAPYAACCLAGLGEVRALAPRTERRLTAAAVALAIGSGIWAIAPPERGPLRARHGGLAWGLGLAPGRFPVRLAGRLAERPEVGPLYNELAHGGYLLWRLHPPRRVFLDGRMELEPGLLREIAAARSSPDAFAALLDRRGAVGALVRYDERRVPLFEPDGRGGLAQVGTTTPHAFLLPPERWALVDWDDEAMLFLRPGAAGWPDPPYRAVQPEDVDGMLRRAAADPAYRAAALAEVARKLDEQPDCRRAAALRRALTGVRPPMAPEISREGRPAGAE